ncbi:MAG: methyltransferase, partial [Xanthobacteraceae bacterium]
AYVAAHDTLARWIEAAARLLRPAGVVTLIWRADGLAAVLDALAGNFGAVTVLPVHPKPNAPAIRVIVRAVKANRTALILLPGLILADANGRPTAEAEAVLRDGALLPLASD